jgi:uncharacterized protein YndB with AHSA1/START domain
MAVDVTTEIVIARPRHEVAAFAVDPDRIALWYVNIRAIEWKTPPPLGVGTRLALAADFLRRRLEYVYEVVEPRVERGARVAFVAHFLGKRIAYTYELHEVVPNARLVMRTAEGPFPMETTYTWRDAAPGRTAMALRNRGTPAGFSRLLAPFLAMAVRRANRKDLALLKSILEARTRREEVAAAPGNRRV